MPQSTCIPNCWNKQKKKFMAKIHLTDKPELLDVIVNNIQTGLSETLGWLDNVFGIAERLVKFNGNGKRIYTPCFYVKKDEYFELVPDSGLGNFAFFVVDDPQGVEYDRSSMKMKTPFSLIFWIDYRTIFNDESNRNKEQVKRQILDSLNGGFWLKSGRIKINRIYNYAENIYRGFSIDEIENQFLMHPFGGFRFEGELEISETCII